MSISHIRIMGMLHVNIAKIQSALLGNYQFLTYEFTGKCNFGSPKGSFTRCVLGIGRFDYCYYNNYFSPFVKICLLFLLFCSLSFIFSFGLHRASFNVCLFSVHIFLLRCPWCNRRCPWCNGFRRRNWTRRHEFKSWTDCISHCTNTLGKGMNPIILLPAMGKIVRRTRFFSLGEATSLKEGKTLNSNLLNSA